MVPAHCQDTYQGWILLLGPVPCHPRGHPQRKSLPLGPDQRVVQQCHMHTQSRAIAGMCPQLLSCHGLGPSSTPSSCVSTLNTSPAAQRPGSPLGSWPRSVAVAKGLSCLVPLAAASCPLQLPSHSAELRKGLKSQGETAHLLHAPRSLRGQRQPPSHPVLVTDEWEERTEGQDDSSEQGWGVWDSLGLEWVPWHEGRLGSQHLPGGTL